MAFTDEAKDTAEVSQARQLGRNLVGNWNPRDRRELLDYLQRAEAADAQTESKRYNGERAMQGASSGPERGGPVGRVRGGVTLENIERCLTFQPAGRFEQLDAFEQVRDGCLALGKVILRKVPECADRSEALRDLRAIRMWCNSAIALDGEF